MEISFDAAKDRRNIAERAISFEPVREFDVREFDWSTAVVNEDLRRDYAEHRFKALGHIDGRLYMLVFTPRADKIHVISLRKANLREIKRHEEETRS